MHRSVPIQAWWTSHASHFSFLEILWFQHFHRFRFDKHQNAILFNMLSYELQPVVDFHLTGPIEVKSNHAEASLSWMFRHYFMEWRLDLHLMPDNLDLCVTWIIRSLLVYIIYRAYQKTRMSNKDCSISSSAAKVSCLQVKLPSENRLIIHTDS